MEIFEISCPQWQLISSTNYSQGEMPDDKVERHQIENQQCSNKTGHLFRSSDSLMANEKHRTVTLGAQKGKQWT